MDETYAKILGFDCAPGSVSHSMGGDLHDDELPAYRDEGGRDDWDLDGRPVHSPSDVRASIH